MTENAMEHISFSQAEKMTYLVYKDKVYVVMGSFQDTQPPSCRGKP
jgi:hypothetical protein